MRHVLRWLGKRYNNSLFGVREYENINFQLLGFLIPLYTNPELIPGLNAVTKTVSEDEGDNHIQMVLSDRMDRFITQKMFPLAPGRISASCEIIQSNGAQPYDGGQGFSTVLLRLPLNYELMVFVNSKGLDDQ